MLAATYTRELQSAYDHYASLPSPPSNILIRAVIRAFRRRYFVRLWCMRCVLLALTMIRPFVLRELLVFVSAAFLAQQASYNDDDQLTMLSFKFASYSQISEGIYWSVTLSLITLVMAFLNHHFVRRDTTLRLFSCCYRCPLLAHGCLSALLSPCDVDFNAGISGQLVTPAHIAESTMISILHLLTYVTCSDLLSV